MNKELEDAALKAVAPEVHPVTESKAQGSAMSCGARVNGPGQPVPGGPTETGRSTCQRLEKIREAKASVELACRLIRELYESDNNEGNSLARIAIADLNWDMLTAEAKIKTYLEESRND